MLLEERNGETDISGNGRDQLQEKIKTSTKKKLKIDLTEKGPGEILENVESVT